jgi:hypothetical protein
LLLLLLSVRSAHDPVREEGDESLHNLTRVAGFLFAENHVTFVNLHLIVLPSGKYTILSNDCLISQTLKKLNWMNNGRQANRR